MSDVISIPNRDFRSTRYIAFEGGGVLGMAYLSVIRELEREKVLRELVGFAGTSAGAIIAMLLALGASSDRVFSILKQTEWGKFPGREWHVRKLVRLVTVLGWNSLDYPREWIRTQIRILGWPSTLTFAQLKTGTGRSLYVPATQESKGSVVVFNPETTPDVSIADAVLASMAIPIYWPAVEIEGEKYSDGGLTMNHPMDAFGDTIPVDQVLGLRLESDQEIKGEIAPIKGIVGRALRLVQIARNQANKAHIPSCYWNAGRVIIIDTGSLSATEFNIASSEIDELLQRGDTAVRDWLGNRSQLLLFPTKGV